NPNVMTKKQHRRLKTSLKKYGFIVPIITNKNLLIADGEQRWTIAKELDMKQVSVIRLPVEDVDRRLLRQVLNKLKGEHELIADAHEFEKIIAAGRKDDLKHLLALSDNQLERYLQEIRETKEENYEIPEIDKIQTNIKRGDIYTLGNHRLMCGDATNKQDVESLMDCNKSDMIFTDPPYGIDYLPNSDLKRLGKLAGDVDYRQTPQDFPVIKNMIPNLTTSCRAGAPIYICTGWSTIGLIIDSLRMQECHIYSVLVWDRKTPRLLPRPQDYIPVNEFIVY
ncbi:unnamed protein product, partial [marine sediment metagenome]